MRLSESKGLATKGHVDGGVTSLIMVPQIDTVVRRM